MVPVSNPCGTTRAKVFEEVQVNGILVYFGSGVNPVNSPAQFFVAWGRDVLVNGLIPTYNKETPEEGFLWFVDEDEAERKFEAVAQQLATYKEK